MADRVIGSSIRSAKEASCESGTTTLIILRLVLEMVEDTEHQGTVEAVVSKRLVCDNVESSADRETVCAVVRKLKLLLDAFPESQLAPLLEQCERLGVTHANARTRYSKTVQQLFHDGVTWGRIVLFCAFSTSYLVHVVRKGMPHLSDSVVKWTVGVFENTLDQWIEQSGGWDNFVAFADKALEGSGGDQVNGLGGRLLAAAAVLGIAALAGLFVGRSGH